MLAGNHMPDSSAFVKIKLLKGILLGAGRTGAPGEIHQVNRELAAELVGNHLARYLEETEGAADTTQEVVQSDVESSVSREATVKVKLLKGIVLGPGAAGPKLGVPGGVYEFPASAAYELVRAGLGEYTGDPEPELEQSNGGDGNAQQA